MFTYRMIRVGEKYALQRRLFGLFNWGCLDVKTISRNIFWWAPDSHWYIDTLTDNMEEIIDAYQKLIQPNIVIRNLP